MGFDDAHPELVVPTRKPCDLACDLKGKRVAVDISPFGWRTTSSKELIEAVATEPTPASQTRSHARCPAMLAAQLPAKLRRGDAMHAAAKNRRVLAPREREHTRALAQ